MQCPLYIDGEARGLVSFEADGLYTRVTAECDSECGMRRIWLHGGGRSAYLGLMGGGRLCRRFTRRELAAFPEKTEYASDRENDKNSAAIEYTAPTESGRVWHRARFGTLLSYDGAVQLTALPCAEDVKAEGADIRMIEGRPYMIFHY